MARKDDGLRYRWPAGLKPSAWWAIDTHMDFKWCLTKASDFEFVFAAQRDGATQLAEAGIFSTTWLPLGCDSGIHSRHDLPKKHDVSFVGHVFPGPRADLIELIRQQGLDFLVDRLYFEEMAKAYSASRVVGEAAVDAGSELRCKIILARIQVCLVLCMRGVVTTQVMIPSVGRFGTHRDSRVHRKSSTARTNDFGSPPNQEIEKRGQQWTGVFLFRAI